MNDKENENTRESGEAGSAKSGGLDFAAVLAKLKNLPEFMSLDGRASKGEYWATVLMLSLPFDLLFVVFALVAGCLDPSGLTFDGKADPVLFTFPMGLFTALAATCLVIADLVMFPVMVRRLRDAKVGAWLAVLCFALAAVPYVGYASGAIILAAGFLPSKAGAEEPAGTGISERVKLWIAAAAFSVLAVAMTGSMIAASITQDNFKDKFGKKFAKAMDQAFDF